jgi:hypothetical protein
MTNSYLPPVVDIIRTSDVARSETARAAAEAARTGAETARTGAETAQAAAQTARTGAETARTGAETARTGAEAAAAGISARSIIAGTGITGGGNLSADRTVSLDLTYTDGRYAGVSGTANASFAVNGQAVWHAGNFTPAAKADLAGAAFTGGISGTSAAFSGAVSGSTGSFSGVVAVANATADGHALNRITADGRFATPASVALKLDATHAGTGGAAHANATTSVAGFLSAADKTKLDALPITKIYTSAQQTYTVGGTLTLAHGLGEVPKFAFVVMRCVTAELGYSVNDEFFWTGQSADGDGSAGRSNPPLIVRDATNIVIRYSPQFRLPGKASNDLSNATAANWRAIFVAVA